MQSVISVEDKGITAYLNIAQCFGTVLIYLSLLWKSLVVIVGVGES